MELVCAPWVCSTTPVHRPSPQPIESDAMTLTDADQPELGSHGWLQVSGLPGGVEVFTRLEDDHNGRSVVREVVVRSDDRVASDHLHRIPLSSVERLISGHQLVAELHARDLEPLQRRSDDTPEKFAERVAQHYLVYSAVSRAPAVTIAEKAQVPVSRVHRWIREARKLGKLPPGRPGTAG
jgi:hypothetical protein